MLPIERKAKILKRLKRDKSVKVNELSEAFQVTEETIRRDLEKLEKEGLLIRSYGGAIIESHVSEELSYTDREKVNIEQKIKIAEAASKLIENGETVFIDASTTALEVIKKIDKSKKVTVITNAIDAIKQMSQLKHITVIGIGGVLNERTLSLEGPLATKFIDRYYADKVIFSVKGITKERGIMDSKESYAEIKNHMIENSRQAVLVVDESKFGNSALIRIVDMKDVDIIVTEYKTDEAWEEIFENNDIHVIVAK